MLEIIQFLETVFFLSCEYFSNFEEPRLTLRARVVQLAFRSASAGVLMARATLLARSC